MDLTSLKFCSDHIILILFACGLCFGGLLWALKYIFKDIIHKIDLLSIDVKEGLSRHLECKMELPMQFAGKTEFLKLTENMNEFRREMCRAFEKLEEDRNKR